MIPTIYCLDAQIDRQTDRQTDTCQTSPTTSLLSETELGILSVETENFFHLGRLL